MGYLPIPIPKPNWNVEKRDTSSLILTKTITQSTGFVMEIMGTGISKATSNEVKLSVAYTNPKLWHGMGHYLASKFHNHLPLLWTIEVQNGTTQISCTHQNSYTEPTDWVRFEYKGDLKIRLSLENKQKKFD